MCGTGSRLSRVSRQHRCLICLCARAHTGRSAMRARSVLHRRLYVLVVAEQVVWVVLLLERGETLIVVAVRCPDPVSSVVFFTPDVVDIESAGGIGLER